MYLIKFVLLMVAFSINLGFTSSAFAGNGASSAYSCKQRTEALVSNRPKEIQQQVDAIFEKVQERPDWGLANGRYGFYNLLATDEAKIIDEIALRTTDQKEVYLIDVGAGAGNWGETAEKLIAEKYSHLDKHFTIISLTGGREHETQVSHHGNIVHYRFNQFKIENIHEELRKKGLNLAGKVDLIVSDWTLQHLVDPIGTLNQLYHLLSPGEGALIANGFSFSIVNVGLTDTARFWDILASSSAKTLFRKWNLSAQLDQFLMVRPNKDPLNLPIHYTEKLVDCPRDCFSEKACEFKLDSNFKRKKKKNFRTLEKNSDGSLDFGEIYYGDQEFFRELLEKKNWFSEGIVLPSTHNTSEESSK